MEYVVRRIHEHQYFSKPTRHAVPGDDRVLEIVAADANRSVPGNRGFIDDVYANPDGSEMSAGYFELRPSDAPLDYLYEYDEMKVVLEGDFLLENLDTGQTQVARAKDAIFFPKGSRIRFTTSEGALAFYVGHRSFAP